MYVVDWELKTLKYNAIRNGKILTRLLLNAAKFKDTEGGRGGDFCETLTMIVVWQFGMGMVLCRV